MEANIGGVLTATSQDSRRRLSFLDFTLDIDDTDPQLRRNGEPVKLPKQELRILSFLAAHGAAAVAKEKLVEVGWQGRKVGAGTIYPAIKKIRDALCESPYVGDHSKASARVSADAILHSDYDTGYALRPPFPVIDFGEEWGRHGPFHGRSSVLLQIEQMLSDRSFTRGYVTLVASPGTGKSAILHRWLMSNAGQDRWVLYHFVRRGVQDWDQPSAVLKNLLAQLGIGPRDVVGDGSTEALREALARALRALSPRKVIILLDGLDELSEPQSSAPPLAAILPATLPEGVHILCGSRPGPHLSWLDARPSTRRINLDDPEWATDNICTCRGLWQHLRKTSGFFSQLSDEFIDSAVAASGGNALYTLTLADMAAVRQQEVGLRELPSGFEALLNQLWTALEGMADGQKGLRVLCAARVPLSLDELEEILGVAFNRVEFLRQAQPLILQDGSRHKICYRIFHGSVRDFILGKMSGEQTKAVHQSIAKTIAQWPPALKFAAFAAANAIYHHAHAGDPEALHALCFDSDHLQAKLRAQSIESLEADMELAARLTHHAKIGQDLATLHSAIRRQSHWIRKDPEALGELIQFALRCSWPLKRSSFAMRSERRPLLRLQHAIQHRDEAIRLLSAMPGSTTWNCGISEDATTVVCTAFEEVALWDLRSGRVRYFAGHSGMILGCALSADVRLMASAGMDCVVRVWDVAVRDNAEDDVDADEDPQRHLVSSWTERGMVGRLAFSGARLVITPNWDGTVGIREARSGYEWRRIEAHSEPVLRCVSSREGARILSASRDGTLGWWDLMSGRLERRLEGHEGSVLGCALAGRGNFAVSGGRDDSLRVWDLRTGRCIKKQAAEQGGINHCIFFDNDRQIVSAGNDGSIKVWGFDPARALSHLEAKGRLPGFPLGAYSLAASPRANLVVTGGYGGVVRVWDGAQATTRGSAERHATSVTHCLFSADQQLAITASDDHTLRIWDVASGRCMRVLRGHAGPITACTIDPSGSMLATGSEDRTVRIWALSSGETCAVLREHTSWVTACIFSNDGDYLFSGSPDGSLLRWAPKEGTVSSIGNDPARPIACAASSGDIMLLGLESGHLEIWSKSRAERLKTMPVPSVTRCAISGDARFGVTVGDDAVLRCWDLERGACDGVLAGHEGILTDCCFWPDNRRIISTSADCTVRLWDPIGRHCERVWYGNSGFISAASGRDHLVAGDFVGNVWFFKILDTMNLSRGSS